MRAFILCLILVIVSANAFSVNKIARLSGIQKVGFTAIPILL